MTQLGNVADMENGSFSKEARLEMDPFMISPNNRGGMPFRLQGDGNQGSDNSWWNKMTGLGPADAQQTKWVGNLYIFMPWAIFVWVLLLWMVVIRYSPEATIVTAVLLGLIFLRVAADDYITQQSFDPDRPSPRCSKLVLGCLCIFAVILGSALGKFGWSRFWRQYWWTQVGQRYTDVSAQSPAAAYRDAATLSFNTTGGVRVAESMSAGYRDGSIYCVAPILDAELATQELISVNFWAVGIGCCQNMGSFSCDASRNAQGGYGVVMEFGGYPCPTCNKEAFEGATRKAEAAYGLASADDAVYVRWTQNGEAVIRDLLFYALGYMLSCFAVGLLLFYLLGMFCWRRGVGLEPQKLNMA